LNPYTLKSFRTSASVRRAVSRAPGRPFRYAVAWSVQLAGGRPLGLRVALALVLVAFCSLSDVGCTRLRGEHRHPVVLLGIDGLEWRVALELIRKGEMPNLAAQMTRGTYGRLSTQHPSMSPSIWTTVATGATPGAHGIRGFVKPGNVLFTNRDRRIKALWNIASEHELVSHVIGWWMTYPVEPLRGIMVAQVNTSIVNPREDDGIRKGALVQGLDHEVWPPELAAPMLEVAADVEKNFPTIAHKVLRNVPSEDDPEVGPMWKQSRWAIRADEIYERVALEALRRQPDVDLAMWYFGGTDVLGHRFWRWAYPGDYAYPPSPESVATYGEILRDYYRYTDGRIGRILAAAPKDANVIIMSDHGMGAANAKKPLELPVRKAVRTGVHGRSEALLVVAGPDFVKANAKAAPADLRERDLPKLGSIYDVAPTVLVLLAIPVARDVKGKVMTALVAGEFLARHPLAMVESHTPHGWAASRNLPEVETPGQDERLEQLRSLGYIQ